MNILALDTASEVLSVALFKGDENWHYEIDAGTRHSELLMSCVDAVMASAGLRPRDLGAVACMKGPGSFTGLRIGFSTAKGMALALGIPLVSFPTLDCMAYHFSIWPGLVLPVMDAKKGRFFAALYRAGERVGDYLDAGPEFIARRIEAVSESSPPLVLTGPGGDMLLPRLACYFPPERLFLDPSRRKGRGVELLEIAKKSRILDNCVDCINESDSGPLYLRQSDAELSRLGL